MEPDDAEDHRSATCGSAGHRHRRSAGTSCRPARSWSASTHQRSPIPLQPSNPSDQYTSTSTGGLEMGRGEIWKPPQTATSAHRKSSSQPLIGLLREHQPPSPVLAWFLDLAPFVRREMGPVYDISAGRQPYGKPGGQPRPNSAQGDPVSRRADPPSQVSHALAPRLISTPSQATQWAPTGSHAATQTDNNVPGHPPLLIRYSVVAIDSPEPTRTK